MFPCGQVHGCKKYMVQNASPVRLNCANSASNLANATEKTRLVQYNSSPPARHEGRERQDIHEEGQKGENNNMLREGPERCVVAAHRLAAAGFIGYVTCAPFCTAKCSLCLHTLLYFRHSYNSSRMPRAKLCLIKHGQGTQEHSRACLHHFVCI